ncbi:MAG: peptidoglycan-binding protein [Clostridia bacterium]|nr:peptidoglycan-binding protein [Clostridia bacterium]
MFCPHCNNRIPDGSNICPLCYANLAGVKPQSAAPAESGEGAPKAKPRSAAKGKKPAYTKGSRGKKSTDKTPIIIAFGLVVILVVIIVLIFRSMFSGTPNIIEPQDENIVVEATDSPNFTVFGATAEPTARPAAPTPTPQIEVTPTPAPAVNVEYHTLRKGDQGRDVITLQQALAELGYLTGAADGNFGTGTQTAVKKFQEEHGLDADGIAGKMTQEALFSIATVTPIPETTVAPGDIMDLPG